MNLFIDSDIITLVTGSAKYHLFEASENTPYYKKICQSNLSSKDFNSSNSFDAGFYSEIK